MTPHEDDGSWAELFKGTIFEGQIPSNCDDSPRTQPDLTGKNSCDPDFQASSAFLQSFDNASHMTYPAGGFECNQAEAESYGSNYQYPMLHSRHDAQPGSVVPQSRRIPSIAISNSFWSHSDMGGSQAFLDSMSSYTGTQEAQPGLLGTGDPMGKTVPARPYMLTPSEAGACEAEAPIGSPTPVSQAQTTEYQSYLVSSASSTKPPRGAKIAWAKEIATAYEQRSGGTKLTCSIRPEGLTDNEIAARGTILARESNMRYNRKKGKRGERITSHMEEGIKELKDQVQPFMHAHYHISTALGLK
ncbi:uncharacterized protein I303_107748 [Kwoniella dejecticola CBS 10117]|uniref:Uncharacterized protein n=1 Tax=Kwoniella dejecticola CBS 10117 TaxID=1296121 RepID=A0A1A5ZVK9_9TREE|nr:uncharacterized protein I303_07753 [Kwoniella dejecticola CBS 10117]OBR81843.1 hypothetical protein I303_07753 [Kwoniella dejecticola CBS 10117]